jgi:hypothetical protein
MFTFEPGTPVVITHLSGVLVSQIEEISAEQILHRKGSVVTTKRGYAYGKIFARSCKHFEIGTVKFDEAIIYKSRGSEATKTPGR